MDPNAVQDASEKPRLTDKQKKDNHIASEQKRRQAIRSGFDKIAMLCGRPGQGRSEAMVLERATQYLDELLAERHNLLQDAAARGIDTTKFKMDAQSLALAAEAAELQILEKQN